MGSLFWIIQWALCYHKGPYKWEREAVESEKEMWQYQRQSDVMRDTPGPAGGIHKPGNVGAL